MALLMAAPLMFFLMGFLPWIVPLLYSNEFGPAIDILRWMIIADVIKIITFPLRFIIIVAGRGRLFMFTELVGAVVFVILVWLLLPDFGVEATGLAYLARYLVYLPMLYFVAKGLSGLDWAVRVIALFLSLMLALVVLAFASSYDDWAGAGLCFFVLISFGFCIYFYLVKNSNDFSLGRALKRFVIEKSSSK